MNIKIRKLSDRDAPELSVEFNNIKIWNQISDSIPHPYTQNDAFEYIRLSYKDPRLHSFAIIFQEKLCGGIGLKLQKDIHRKSAELGYWVSEKHWNKGIAGKAIALISDWGFQNLEINRIFARVFQNNIASMKALEKNSYRLEGILQKAIFKNNEFLDEYIYAKLKNL